HVGDQTLVELLDVHAAMVRERHGRRAKARRVGDGEIHLVLRGNRAFEGHAIRLGGLVAVPMLDEIEALFFLERGLEILGAPQQAGFALLADTSLEHRLHEYRAVTLDQCLDFLLAGVRAQHFRCGEARKSPSLKRFSLRSPRNMPVTSSAFTQSAPAPDAIRVRSKRMIPVAASPTASGPCAAPHSRQPSPASRARPSATCATLPGKWLL